MVHPENRALLIITQTFQTTLVFWNLWCFKYTNVYSHTISHCIHISTDISMFRSPSHHRGEENKTELNVVSRRPKYCVRIEICDFLLCKTCQQFLYNPFWLLSFTYALASVGLTL